MCVQTVSESAAKCDTHCWKKGTTLSPRVSTSFSCKDHLANEHILTAENFHLSKKNPHQVREPTVKMMTSALDSGTLVVQWLARRGFRRLDNGYEPNSKGSEASVARKFTT